MSKDWIRGISIRRTPEGKTVAVAECSVSGTNVSVSSDGVDGVDHENSQLAELRRRLYAAGFSKRAIATACKGVAGRDD